MNGMPKCCKGCRYWRLISATGGASSTSYCCHYLLLTGSRCGRTGDECTTRRKEK